MFDKWHVNVYNILRNYNVTRNLWKAGKISNIISARVRELACVVLPSVVLYGDQIAAELGALV